MKKLEQNFKPAFSLMEMMVVLLIISIIAAVSAPMVTKKISRDAQTADNPWSYTNLAGNIGYNMRGNNEISSIIGSSIVPITKNIPAWQLPFNNPIQERFTHYLAPKLFIASDANGQMQDRSPGIAFGDRNRHYYGHITMDADGNVVAGKAYPGFLNAGGRTQNSIIMGTGAYTLIGAGNRALSENNIVIGREARTLDSETIAIGHGADAEYDNSTVIGHLARIIRGNNNAITPSGIAMGHRAVSNGGVAIGNCSADNDNNNTEAGNNSIAIGRKARALPGQSDNQDAIAIGNNTTVNGQRSIAIGSNYTTSATSSIAVIPRVDGNGNGTSLGGTGNVVLVSGNNANAHVTGSNNVVIASSLGSSEPVSAGTIAAGFNDTVLIGNRGANARHLDESGQVRISDKINARANSMVLNIPGDANHAAGNLTIGNGGSLNAAGGRFTVSDRGAIRAANGRFLVSDTGIITLFDNSSVNTVMMRSDTGFITTRGPVYSGGLWVGPNGSWVRVIDEDRNVTTNNLTVNGTLDVKTLKVGEIISTTKVYSNGYMRSYISDYDGAQFIKFGTSDRRLKNVGEKFKGGLEELKKLDFYHFTFKKDKEKIPHVGVIAQDLQKVFPDAVKADDEGYLMIRWEDMFYAVINAVKELDNKIAAVVEKVQANFDEITKLKATVAEQQKTIKELQAQNADFEKRLAKLEKKAKKCEE